MRKKTKNLDKVYYLTYICFSYLADLHSLLKKNRAQEGTSRVVQWLGLHLPLQEVRV